MYLLIQAVKERLIHAFQEVFGSEYSTSSSIEINVATNPQFGHYQCNAAMRLSKVLGKPPRVLAEEVQKHLLQNNQGEALFFTQIEVAGPGFINLWIAPTIIEALLKELARQERCGATHLAVHQKVIVEFSSPNIAKEMHVGHLRSTIIGDCLARLFEWMGYDVLRLNHLGDWGTAFGMLIAYLKQFHPQVITQEEKAELPDLMRWYREAKKTFDEDDAFKQNSREQVVALQGGDPVALKAWKEIVAISEKSYQAIYSLLGVRLLSRGESFYNPFLAQVVEDAENSGYLKVDQGARCIFLEGFENRDGTPLPFMIQKSDGGYNYATTDLAALKHRIQVEKADRIICVVDMGQSLHFKMLKKAAEKIGYLDPARTQFDHVAFGLVLGADGKKFKTRSGDTEKLIDLLTESVVRAKAILLERKVSEVPEELEHLALSLGVNAVKYADLSCNRQSDYTFSYDKMLRFEGNTAAFLMYALVRIKSIRKRIGMQQVQWDALQLVHPSEFSLGLHLARFPEILNGVIQDLFPNRIAEYLFELAEKFNAFFRDCHVEGSREQDARLALCAITEQVLETGLYLLGLRSVDRM